MTVAETALTGSSHKPAQPEKLRWAFLCRSLGVEIPMHPNRCPRKGCNVSRWASELEEQLAIIIDWLFLVSADTNSLALRSPLYHGSRMFNPRSESPESASWQEIRCAGLPRI